MLFVLSLATWWNGKCEKTAKLNVQVAQSSVVSEFVNYLMKFILKNNR